MVTLQKVHGSENSFFLFDETQLTQPLTNTQLATVTQQLTNAETGLLGGADGVLAILALTELWILFCQRFIRA